LLLQVYAFDKVSIIMDNVRGAIKAKVSDRWISVSLQELMEQNTLRKSKVASVCVFCHTELLVCTCGYNPAMFIAAESHMLLVHETMIDVHSY